MIKDLLFDILNFLELTFELIRSWNLLTSMNMKLVLNTINEHNRIALITNYFRNLVKNVNIDI